MVHYYSYTKTRDRENVEKLESSYIAGRNVK